MKLNQTTGYRLPTHCRAYIYFFHNKLLTIDYLAIKVIKMKKCHCRITRKLTSYAKAQTRAYSHFNRRKIVKPNALYLSNWKWHWPV